MRVLILGGYGTFGSRLIRLLADEPRLTLIAAGRSAEKATAFLATLTAKATLIPATVDRNGDLAAALADQRPDILIDASGPFQTYGDRPYRVVEACLTAGIDYIDLADGAAFVEGITQFDSQAQQTSTAIISGASTFPALSSAIVTALTTGWQQVEAIQFGLAPSPKAGLGRSVIGAILSYAGQPIPTLANGQSTPRPALIDSRRWTIAPPGIEPLPPMTFRLIDLPDQRLFPNRWTKLQTLWPGVATRPQSLQWGLACAARLVQWRVFRSLSRLTGPAHGAMQRATWGTHRGGLILQVSGTDAEGAKTSRSWHMIAEADDGPFIPAIAAATLIRRRLTEPLNPGARPALDDVSLAEFEAEFSNLRITTGIRDTLPTNAPLYHRMLGPAWQRVPEPIRALHANPDGLQVAGTATVERGSGILARAIAAVVGFPKTGTDVPVSVTFSERDGKELWQRSFAGKQFESTQKQGTGSFEGLLSERFGPLEFGLSLVLKDDRLWLITRKWRAFGIPMPAFLAPGGDAFEHVEDGTFQFHVEIKHWLTGPIVRYQGHLSPLS